MAFLSAERRRRVLTEQVITATAETTPTKKEAGKQKPTGPSYAPEALTGQPTVADLLPRRYSSIALWFLLAALAVAGIETLYVYQSDWTAVLTAGHAVALDLRTAGSLAGWFSSLLLLLAAAASLAIYSVRRHRIDDYHGRYRVWILAALCWTGFSAGIATGLHLAVMDLMRWATGWSGWLAGACWWLAPAAAAVGTMTLRLVVEMRRCRFGAFVLLTALACWSTSVALFARWLTLPSALHSTLVMYGTQMAGHCLLLLSLLLYARHVVLDAGGKIPQRAPKPKRERAPKRRATKDNAAAKTSADGDASAAKSRNVRVDAGHGGKTSASSGESSRTATSSQPVKRAAGWTDGSEQDDDDDFDDEDGDRKLSKAERKRLRRLRAREDRTSL